ncbi:hypothetical protein FRC04_009591 [Tulasnella sp. 424]|nr:hypothetical protein FRC04_009591 [Tulasnella sp. 424]KAG8975891.1 hypothetical protein FRC05_004821 [Tulasnella sp. 425]
MAGVAGLLKSILAAFRAILPPFRHPLPPGLQRLVSPRDDIESVVEEASSSSVPWLPLRSVTEFKGVVPVGHDQILLGWKKNGFDKHHFGPFAVHSERGETTAQAVKRSLKSMAGISVAESSVEVVGRILFVTEGQTEAREETLIRASAWRGNIVETKFYIPARFHRTPFRSTAPVEKREDDSDSSYSTDSLPSFLPMDTPKNGISFHSIMSSCSLWSSSKTSRSAMSDSDSDDCLPALLPWHCMHPEDKVWYPLLISGQKFIGRVDYSASSPDGSAGQIRRYWFATVSQS